MGKFSLNCLASSRSELFGIAFNQVKQDSPKDTFHVLLKSNPSPVDVASISWTLVSTIRAESRLDTGFPPLCAVDEKGTFSVLVRGSNGDSTRPPLANSGLFYDPGSGLWSPLTGPQTMWQDLFETHSAIAYLKNPTASSGKDLVVVNYLAGLRLNDLKRMPPVIQFFKLETATGAFVEGPQWNFSVSTQPTLETHLYSLFLLDNALELIHFAGFSSTLTSIPFPDGVIPAVSPTAGFKVLNTTRATEGCDLGTTNAVDNHSGNYDRIVFITCRSRETWDAQVLASVHLDSIHPTTFSPPAPIPQKLGSNYQSRIGVSSSVPFLLLTSLQTMSGLNLAGPRVGQFQEMMVQVNTTGQDIGTPFSESELQSAATKDGAVRTKAIVGGVVGAFVAILLVYFIMRRKKTKAAEDRKKGKHVGMDTEDLVMSKMERAHEEEEEEEGEGVKVVPFKIQIEDHRLENYDLSKIETEGPLSSKIEYGH